MKKLALLLVLGALAVSCTNQKVVQYNTDRLDKIEVYLKENKFVKPTENLEKLQEEGKIEVSKEYLPLEKEAEQWFKDKQQVPQEQTQEQQQ